ncbi:hypothetical protein DHEL01_v206803 [Diaporthe helianthi]|uniref:Uncharacterized protein n=1 Tax=Diaporthe helianthi TaxID=158607 RepID=A0A2P5HX28_DIAHE|nr:hypothetical protein DHEL01_v206803 [Diaporthe helianthi]
MDEKVDLSDIDPDFRSCWQQAEDLARACDEEMAETAWQRKRPGRVTRNLVRVLLMTRSLSEMLPHLWAIRSLQKT